MPPAFPKPGQPPRPAQKKNQNGPAAGHTQQPASWASRLARTGQLSAQGSRSAFSRGPQPWNDRIPVWEQCIPQWDRQVLPQTMSSVDRNTMRQISTASSTTRSVCKPFSFLLPPRSSPLQSQPWLPCHDTPERRSIRDALNPRVVPHVHTLSPLATYPCTASQRGFDGTVTRDWSLLFSPGRQELLVRRPWPGEQSHPPSNSLPLPPSPPSRF